MADLAKRFTALFKPKTKTEASFEVRAIAKHYPDGTTIYAPHTPIKKLLPHMEGVRKLTRSSDSLLGGTEV